MYPSKIWLTLWHSALSEFHFYEWIPQFYPRFLIAEIIGPIWFIVFKLKSSNLSIISIYKTDCRAFSAVLTPCWSSFSSCSGTLGELAASLRHWVLISGTTYSRTSLRGSPREVPCLAVEGTASSRIEPLKVVSWRWTEWREKFTKKRKVHNVDCIYSKCIY